ncbi:hypothetical protein M9H77_31312 [Catharanthus roseus]|uniref:Uncharacterized protein n=1 Tax=Catharanthus roseus TaxID=4058 RepID=A0ACC0A1K0_CATRO|nr:hypothetical protein M9H77_31312 [Catharanthus roseus]
MNPFALDYNETKKKKGLNGERKGTRPVLLGTKAASSGVEYSTKGPRTSRQFFFWAAVHRWISPIQPPIENFNSPGQQAGDVFILCDNTTKLVALLVGQLCDNTTEKAALSCNMLWSQHPYKVLMSFTRFKPGPHAVRKIGRNLSGTTHSTLPPIGGRSSYSCPNMSCNDLK